MTGEISPEYLAAMRQALRISTEGFDDELRALIAAARSDLALCGVLPERAADESDPLIRQAVTVYLRAEFGLGNDDADRYRAAYDRLKIALALSSDYIIGEAQ